MIEVQAVSHLYRRGSPLALSGVTAAIGRGERVAIIGESASGKSTLLMALAGLLKPSCGCVLIDGTPIVNVPPTERGLSLVFQSPPHMPRMRVIDLLMRPARREDSATAPARVSSALAAVELHLDPDTTLAELSGGQRQRCFLARSLVWRPQLMLLDEPFSNLDVRTKRLIIPRILAHQTVTGAALVFITHDAEEAALVADRYLLLHQGRIVSHGPTATAAVDPPSEFAALVFRGGTSNLIPARLYAEQDHHVLKILGGMIAGIFDGQMPAGEVTVLVSATQLRLGNDGAGGWIEFQAAEKISWTPVSGGVLAVGQSESELLYVSDLRHRGFSGHSDLALERCLLPIFERETGLRAGTFKIA